MVKFYQELLLPIEDELKRDFYAALNGKAEGSYSITEVSRLIAEKKVVKETYVWKSGMAQWNLVENIAELLRLVALTPPPIPSNKP